jgi:hydrogenase nickel incorporation protein HypB
MCTTCGCGNDAKATLTNSNGDKVLDIHSHDHGHHDHLHDHDHSHTHDHHHEHSHSPSSVISLEKEILAKNNFLAGQNRGWFEERNILALNLVSSPGAGKTTLLEQTLKDLKDEISLSVIEGDQETVNDAERIRATGCKVVQINTGTGCHLEADMLARGLKELQPPRNSVLMIENVGNLVCPALFDLGERAKVAVLSVTEGEDKPLKYPHMFQASNIMILNKIDLLPYVEFNVDKCWDFIVVAVFTHNHPLSLVANGGIIIQAEKIYAKRMAQS